MQWKRVFQAVRQSAIVRNCCATSVRLITPRRRRTISSSTSRPRNRNSHLRGRRLKDRPQLGRRRCQSNVAMATGCRADSRSGASSMTSSGDYRSSRRHDWLAMYKLLDVWLCHDETRTWLTWQCRLWCYVLNIRWRCNRWSFLFSV